MARKAAVSGAPSCSTLNDDDVALGQFTVLATITTISLSLQHIILDKLIWLIGVMS